MKLYVDVSSYPAKEKRVLHVTVPLELEGIYKNFDFDRPGALLLYEMFITYVDIRRKSIRWKDGSIITKMGNCQDIECVRNNIGHYLGHTFKTDASTARILAECIWSPHKYFFDLRTLKQEPYHNLGLLCDMSFKVNEFMRECRGFYSRAEEEGRKSLSASERMHAKRTKRIPF
jgi:hypothetical protein